MQIYVLIDKQPQGPYTPEDVRKYLKTGQLQPADLGAYAGSSDWKTLQVMMQSWGDAAPASARRKPKDSKKAALRLAAGAIVLVASLAVAMFFVRVHRQSLIQGAWEGVLEPVPGVKIRVVNHISASDGFYRATCDCIELRQKDILMEKFVYDYPAVGFECNGAGGSFQGKLNADASEISGTWTQEGGSVAAVWKRTATPDTVPELLSATDYTPRAGSALQGYWRGTINTGPVSLRVVFKIAEPADGKYIAELDSLDQGATNMVVSSVTYDKRKVRMEVGRIGGAFEGKTSSNGGKIAGTWTQAGVPFPLILTRADPKTAAGQANDYTRVANQLMLLFNAGDYAGIQTNFNAEMDAALPLDKSSAFFSRLTRQLGKIQTLGEPHSAGEEMVFPAKFEKGMADMRIALDGSDLIAGLTFKPHTATKTEQVQMSRANRYTKAANQLKELINAGDYAGIQARFNKEMGAALPLDKSSEFFKGLTQQAGKIQNLGPPQTLGEGMVFPAEFEKDTLDMRIALDGSGLIAGLTFTPHLVK